METSCGVVLVNFGSILLLQYPQGHWDFPKGHVEDADADRMSTAGRELKEETNLTPSKMFIADHVSSFYEKHGDRINFVPVFGIEVDSMDVTLSDEHCEFKWVELDKALSYLVWEGQKKGIKTVHDMVFSGDERMKWSQIDLS